MAYTLKTTGIATNLRMCLAVNDDGATVTEFVSSTVDSQKDRLNRAIELKRDYWPPYAALTTTRPPGIRH